MPTLVGIACNVAWRGGREVRQRPAKPRTPVRIRSAPFSLETAIFTPGDFLHESRSRTTSHVQVPADEDTVLDFLAGWSSVGRHRVRSTSTSGTCRAAH